ncbi:MAG: diacylglycerol kinase family lipid kinase [Chloroflexi bacterium]|nr:diacylglycerol kinase family lipid kinase [Chloroflexota bacterium]
MPKRVKLIFNPIANLGRAWPVAAALRPIVLELGGADWSGTVYPSHATELARQAGEDGYELVVAMGGDGTVHEVVNGLMQVPADKRPHLGVVPVGSGNDFAHAVGISTQPEQALRQAMGGSPRRLDIGYLEDGGGRTEYWTNTVGIGFDTAVTIRSRKVPILQGFAVYFAAVLQTILFNFEPFQVKVKSDTGEWEDELLMFVMCNGPREGGGFIVAPKAKTDDGIFSYLGVQHITRPRMLMTIPYFLKGTQERLHYVRMGEFHNMEIEANKPMYIHTDGEIFTGFGSTTRRLKAGVLPNAIETIC